MIRVHEINLGVRSTNVLINKFDKFYLNFIQVMNFYFFYILKETMWFEFKTFNPISRAFITKLLFCQKEQ